MSVTTVRLQDDTMAWAKEYADFKGISVTALIANLIEEARQDDEDYADAVKVINSENRDYVSPEEIKAKFNL
jgi:predicted DNA-binding ribbon-helix-helix protein